MITLIEAIFGSKVGRTIAEALLVILIVGAAMLYLEHRGAEREVVKLQKSSATLIAKSNADIAKTNADHAAENTANQEKLHAAVTASNTLSDALDNRVRDFDAYRRAHPAMASPVGGSIAASAGECGARSCGDIAAELAVRGDDLARNSGVLSASLQACQRDRDSLTGLPK
jgi:hypothetical protein